MNSQSSSDQYILAEVLKRGVESSPQSKDDDVEPDDDDDAVVDVVSDRGGVDPSPKARWDSGITITDSSTPLLAAN